MQSTFLDLTDPPVATSRRARAAKAVPTIREALAPYIDMDALLHVKADLLLTQIADGF